MLHDTGETDGINLKQGKTRRTQPCYSRVTIPCDLWPFLHFSPNATAHLLAEVVWNKACYVWNGQVETDTLIPFNCMAGGSPSSVWNIACCVWNGQVKTDTLIPFNCTAMLTQIPFRSGSTVLLNHTAEMARVSAPLDLFIAELSPEKHWR